jgi:hypothetical protein
MEYFTPQPTSFEDSNPVFAGGNAGMQAILNSIKAAYAPQNAEAELQLNQAKGKRENALANLPFGGHNLPGSAGQVLGLEYMAKMFGKDSPQYQRALQSFQLSQESDQSRINYQNSLTNSMPQRYLTPTGKGFVEQANVEKGLAPSGQTWDKSNPYANAEVQGQPPPMQGPAEGDIQRPPIQQLAPASQALQGGQQQEQPQSRIQLPPAQKLVVDQLPQNTPGTNEMSGVYQLLRQKGVTDPDTRKRNLFATNIEKTLDQINVDNLVKYSGVVGGASKIGQQVADAFSKSSPEYKEYKKASKTAEFLATQVRQFYGDSIQPEMIKRLESLTNPTSWATSPELAKALFNQTKGILGMEMQTYRDALKTTKAYQKQESSEDKKLNLKYTPENIEHTAKVRGISVEEVKRRLGI